MATPLTDTQMSQVLDRIRAQGVTVREVHDWRTNNRNHKGKWGPVHGVTWHHTASLSDSESYVDWIFHVGRPDVPGPIPHFFVERDGTLWIGSNGRANHFGLIDRDTLAALQSGLTRDTPEIHPSSSGDVDGNARLYGIEVAGIGGTPDYTDAQYRTCVVLSGELLRALFGDDTGPDVIGHSEGTTRKPNDPNYDMRRVRADVADYLEDDMALTDSDKRDIAKLAADEVWSRMLLHPDGNDTKRVRADMAHFWDRRALDRVAEKVGAPVDVDESAIAESLVPAIREAVAEAGSTDPEVIAKAVARLLGTSLSNA